MALVEELLGCLDHRGDDAGLTDDVAAGAHRSLAHALGDLADLERQLGRPGEGVPALVHRRRPRVRRLPPPGDAVSLHAKGAKDGPQRQVERLQHRPLLDVKLEVGSRRGQLPPSLG
ncbi:MAG: hypothetical protein C4307_05370, partial [Chloroflexota bacterium]